MTDGDLRHFRAPRWYARLLCAVFGHKRGRRTANAMQAIAEPSKRTYICPRCGATWTRKVRAK